MSRDLGTRRRRALFRAHHRGTKEMDVLLGRFADARLAHMSEAELDCFERLLTLADPELYDWIMAPQSRPAADFAGLIEELRRFHNSTGSPA